MIILHITTVPETLGFVLKQMLFMRGRACQIHAVSSPGKYREKLRSHSIPFHPVKMERRVTPFRDLVAITRLWMVIQRVRPAIVHAHTPKAGLLGMISATLARVPGRVFHVHGLPHLTARGLRRPLLVWSTKVACLLAHRVFCVSQSIRQILIDQNLCPEDKVVVPANGSSSGIEAQDEFNPANIGEAAAKAVRARYGVPVEAFVIAFIGRLVRDKGAMEMCKAWLRLRSDHPNMHLLIVGDFEPQDPIPSALLEVFRSDPRIRMTGFCENMPELLAAIDLVAFPSYREGFPNVLLEAASMSLPVVATAIPGCVDAVQDGVTGTLVPPYDVSALVSAIQRYIQDPELRRSHGVRARERVLRDFQPEPIWEFSYTEYRRLLSGRGAPLANVSSGQQKYPEF
jgi:glycosyltransferase involved in cell wall biosynthesis